MKQVAVLSALLRLVSVFGSCKPSLVRTQARQAVSSEPDIETEAAKPKSPRSAIFFSLTIPFVGLVGQPIQVVAQPLIDDCLNLARFGAEL